MKVIMDFVPNHVAREYHSICKPAGVRDLGEDDDTNMHFSTKNNFYYAWGDLDLNEVRYSKPEFKGFLCRKDAKIYEPYTGESGQELREMTVLTTVRVVTTGMRP